MHTVVILIFLAALYASSACAVTVPCGGSTAPYPLYTQLFFGWQLLVPDTTFDYEQTTSVRGMNALINRTLVWSGTDLQPTAVQQVAARANGMALKLLPMAAVSVLPFAHYSSLGVSSLRMSKRTLALIWLGNISRWNDAAIVATNPSLASVNESIKLVIQDGPAGTLQIFQTAVSQLLHPGEWPFNISNVWPQQLIARWGDRVIYTAVGNPTTYAKVSLTPYSLGYVVQSLLVELGVPLTSFVLLDQAANVSVVPEPAALTAAAAAATFDPVTGVALSNFSLPPDAWPIFGFTYALFNANFSGMSARDCAPYSEAFHFFVWLLTERQPHLLALGLGYAVTPRDEAQRLIAELSTMHCAGKKLLAVQFEPQRDEAVWDAMLAIAMILLPVPVLLALGAVVKMLDRHGNVFFIVSTATGSCLLLVAVIFFYLVPSDTSICVLRTFFVGIGFVLLTAPISTKVLWCLWIVKRSKQLRSVEVPLARLALPLLVAVCLQLVLLIVWAAVDTYSSTVVITSQFLQTAVYVCSSDNNWVWFGIEIGFFAALLVTAFVLYWSAGGAVLRAMHDVSWMGFTLYNLLVVMVLLIPLLAGFDNPEDQQYFIICIGLIFPALFTSCTLYGPIVLPQVFYMMSSTSRRSKSKTSTTPPPSSSSPSVVDHAPTMSDLP